jgi:Fungal specific transcription factor domain
MNSCFTLKPVFSPLRLHEPYIAAVKNWAMPASPSSPAQILGRPFRRLPDCGITDTMLEVLSCMEAITMAIDHYLQGKPSGLTLGQIVRTRTGIQKQLLLLPTAKELKIKPSSRPNLYECCRLTAIMFSIAVIYPIPNTYNVLQALVRGLTASLEVMDIESHSVDYSGLLLWMLVLGGIAALEKPERPWFASNLALLSRRDDLRLDWNGAEDILKSFLWLQSACSPGGHQLWDEVMSFTV